MDKEVEKFAYVVEDMILQLTYPGFEKRSLKLGLPDSVSKLPPRTYAQALEYESAVVRIAALRWFQEHAGIAKSHLRLITGCLKDSDEWVRKEAVYCIEKLNFFDENILAELCAMVLDPDLQVRKEVAKALGKLGCKSQTVIDALQTAAKDEDHEVRWKAQKSLRKLGAYIS